MSRQERSAGFILFRNDSAAPGGRVYLLLDYGRHWDFPKGHVEKGETDLEAALRELHEETGIASPRVIEGFSHEIEYFFRASKGGMIQKRVIFFLAETDESKVILSKEHVAFAFLNFEAALKRLGYVTAKEILRKAHEHMR